MKFTILGSLVFGVTLAHAQVYDDTFESRDLYRKGSLDYRDLYEDDGDILSRSVWDQQGHYYGRDLATNSFEPLASRDLYLEDNLLDEFLQRRTQFKAPPFANKAIADEASHGAQRRDLYDEDNWLDEFLQRRTQLIAPPFANKAIADEASKGAQRRDLYDELDLD